MYLANSKEKQNLVSHLIGTMKMSMFCARKLGVDKELEELCGLAAFLHDIGKCSDFFQNVTLKGENVTLKGEKGKYPRHNEISWLFAQFKIKHGTLAKRIVPQAIYWHHGTYLFESDILGNTPRTTIIINELDSYNSNEFQKIFDRMSSIIKDINFPFDIDKYLDKEDDSGVQIPRLFEPVQIPRLFETDRRGEILNAQRLIVRSCVIYADHVVSRMSSEQLENFISEENFDDYFSAVNIDKHVINRPINYNADRFNLQCQIVEKCGRTSVIKAPAGFGKSLIGILWGLKQNGQVLWVCPRNTVAEGVYQNIKDELKELNVSLSVELYLTGERKAATHEGKAVCKSDIVVTNIDNLLAPMTNQNHTSRLFDVNIGNVVFDEFHEFVNEEALFGAFIVYMQARHYLCKNTKTILLSATPSIIHKLWDSDKDPVVVLPGPDRHYPAQHTKNYKFTFSKSFITDANEGSLTMYSSISNVQKYYKNGYTDIIHSKYSDDDRDIKLNKILTNFGKGGNKSGIVISAPILQAALNISFNQVFKTIESPESDIQTFGRVNRWGEENTICLLNMLELYSDNAEKGAVICRYDYNLSKDWCDFIKCFNNTTKTLDDIYTVYNKFNNKFSTKILEFLLKRHDEAIEKLSTFFPKQRWIKPNESKLISGKTLRQSAPTYFIVVKKDSGKWCDFYFSIEKQELDKLINDNHSKLSKLSTMEKVWLNLSKIKYFDYSNVINKYNNKKKRRDIRISELVKLAKHAETPLPIFTMEYDSTLGLRKKG